MGLGLVVTPPRKLTQKSTKNPEQPERFITKKVIAMAVSEV
jgi:hypothetical protein